MTIAPYFMSLSHPALKSEQDGITKSYSFFQSLVISSKVLPLVSGTSFHTKMAAMIQITPYKP